MRPHHQASDLVDSLLCVNAAAGERPEGGEASVHILYPRGRLARVGTAVPPGHCEELRDWSHVVTQPVDRLGIGRALVLLLKALELLVDGAVEGRPRGNVPLVDCEPARRHEPGARPLGRPSDLGRLEPRIPGRGGRIGARVGCCSSARNGRYSGAFPDGGARS